MARGSTNALNRLPNGELHPRQEVVAVSIATGTTMAAAARAHRVSNRQVTEWMAGCPAFVNRIREVRRELTSAAIGRGVDTLSMAFDTLRELLTARAETVRLGAARSIIELTVKVRETVELEERIAQLEQRTQR